MKKSGIICGIGLLMLASGCSGYKDYDKNIITIAKNGAVNETIQESFEEAYYIEEELLSSIEAEVASYNSGTEKEPVELKKCEVDEQIATVKMAYDTTADYASFNHVGLFHGTMSEFVESEYHAYADLKDMDGGEIPLSSLVASGEDYYVVALDMDCIVEVKGNICYVSEGVEVIAKKTADVTMGEGTAFAYIVYK